jgi:hypothetical protein
MVHLPNAVNMFGDEKKSRKRRFILSTKQVQSIRRVCVETKKGRSGEKERSMIQAAQGKKQTKPKPFESLEGERGPKGRG